MITDLDEIRLAAWLRETVADAIRGIDDADPDFRFDQSPNWATRKRLEEIVDDATARLSALGWRQVWAHGDCGGRRHCDVAETGWRDGSSYYVVEIGEGRHAGDLVIGTELRMDDESWRTDLRTFVDFQARSTRKCPCSRRSLPSAHTVFPAWLWSDRAETAAVDLCYAVERARSTIELAADRRRRSAVREALTDILLDLERAIVPEAAEAYLARRLREAEGAAAPPAPDPSSTPARPRR